METVLMLVVFIALTPLPESGNTEVSYKEHGAVTTMDICTKKTKEIMRSPPSGVITTVLCIPLGKPQTQQKQKSKAREA